MLLGDRSQKVKIETCNTFCSMFVSLYENSEENSIVKISVFKRRIYLLKELEKTSHYI